MIKIMLQFNGKSLTIPVNPEELNIETTADNDDIDIIGLGKITRKGDPGLKRLTIESFFPSINSYWYTGVSPRTCIEFIESIWKADNTNNNVGKIVTTDLSVNLNMYFVIDNFEYDYRAGEEDDVYYTLELKQYIPYGAKVVSTQLSGLAAARAVSTEAKPIVQNNPTTSNTTSTNTRTYTVVRGDCLWNISKKYTGKGSVWPELYELNKGVIGNNPNLIYPGQVLTIPAGW